MRSTSELIAAEALLGLHGGFIVPETAATEPSPAQAAAVEQTEENGDSTLTRPGSRQDRQDSGVSTGTTSSAGSEDVTAPAPANEHVESQPGPSKRELQGDDEAMVPETKRQKFTCDETEMPCWQSVRDDLSTIQVRLNGHVRVVRVPETTKRVVEHVVRGLSALISTFDKPNEEREDNNTVEIGSGRTRIALNKFRKLTSLKSYSKATRTLLLACFPRRILATHSLTGKKSPAFPGKPAKNCLDEGIVRDIELEVAKQFNVARNLIRAVITTKCADECKMLKMKKKTKK